MIAAWTAGPWGATSHGCRGLGSWDLSQALEGGPCRHPSRLRALCAALPPLQPAPRTAPTGTFAADATDGHQAWPGKPLRVSCLYWLGTPAGVSLAPWSFQALRAASCSR